MASDGTTLYCGNLAWTVTDEELHALFASKCGAKTIVSAKVSRFEDSERSKGWGLVVFKTAGDASKAVEKMAGVTLGDREVTVREDRGPSERRPAAVRSEQPADDTVLFVGNLSFDCDDGRLAALFAGMNFQSAEIQRKSDGTSKGYGLVKMDSAAAAAAAIAALEGREEGGREITVRGDRPRVRKPRARKPRAPRTEGEEGAAAADGEGQRPRRRRNRRAADGAAEGVEPAAAQGDGGSAEAAPRRRRQRNRANGGGAAEAGGAATAAGEGGEGEGGTRRRRNRRKPAEPSSTVTVFVKNLPGDMTSDGLRALFARHGAASAVVKTDADGNSKGFGVVTLGSEDAVAGAIAVMNGHAVQGQVLEVREDKQPPRRRAAPAQE